MWQKVGRLFDRREAAVDEVDVRFAVERWLRDRNIETARCTEARGGRVVVYGGERVLEREGDGDFNWLLPVATAQEVIRLFGSVEQVAVLSQENYVSFQGEGVDLSSRLIAGTYPNYQQIIPTSFKTTGSVKREELQRALKVVGVFMSRDSRRVQVIVNPSKGLLVLSVEGGETGQGTVEVPFGGEGETIEALFNINYLLEGVQHMAGEVCKVSLGGISDPITLESVEGARHLYIVMPIQA